MQATALEVTAKAPTPGTSVLMMAVGYSAITEMFPVQVIPIPGRNGFIIGHQLTEDTPHVYFFNWVNRTAPVKWTKKWS